jgi:hypothetical protein
MILYFNAKKNYSLIFYKYNFENEMININFIIIISLI